MTDRIATKKKTREILENYGFHTKKKFGQNFIVEPGVVDKIAQAVADRNLDTVIEIGPGIGALTQALDQRIGQVEVFEIDPACIPVLEKEIASDHLTIHNQDFLEVDVDALLKEHEGKIGFASNLPYYITTPLLFKLFEASGEIDSITVMMQKEVADRFTAPVGSKAYNALSVIIQYLCTIHKVMDVNRNVFWPSPNVDSAVLQFTFKKDLPLNAKEQTAFFEFVKACFVQRRKTLYNNLQSLNPDKQLLKELFEKAGIPESTRAQQLDVSQFLHLFEIYESLSKDEG